MAIKAQPTYDDILNDITDLIKQAGKNGEDSINVKVDGNVVVILDAEVNKKGKVDVVVYDSDEYELKPFYNADAGKVADFVESVIGGEEESAGGADDYQLALEKEEEYD